MNYYFDYSKLTVMDIVVFGSQFAKDNPMAVISIIDKCGGGEIANRPYQELPEIIEQFTTGLLLNQSDVMSQIADIVNKAA